MSRLEGLVEIHSLGVRILRVPEERNNPGGEEIVVRRQAFPFEAASFIY